MVAFHPLRSFRFRYLSMDDAWKWAMRQSLPTSNRWRDGLSVTVGGVEVMELR